MSALTKIFGTHSDRELKRITPLVDKVESYRDGMKALSDEELRGKTKEYKERLEKGETLDDLLPEAYATVREAASRVLGMEHYRVQIIGGIILHQGRIAEMKTGEGKTLVSTLPAYLNALEGKGVYIVTVNDYLAKRDSDQMGQVYEWMGLSCGCITQDMEAPDRKVQYAKDITYITNNELGFDYLRDNMAVRKSQMVQRGLHFCIIDEVDSVLIDEARTPLIISGTKFCSKGKYLAFDRFAKETGAKIEDLKTWEGLFAMAEQYAAWTDNQTPDVPGDGKNFFVHDYHFNYFQVGVESLGENFFKGENLAFGPEFQTVWEPYAKAALSGGVWLRGGYATEPLRTGDSIVSVASSASVLYYSDEVTYADNTSEKVEIVSMPCPVFARGETMVMQRGAGICTVKSTPEKEKACITFLKWLTEAQKNVEFVTSLGYMPVKQEAFDVYLPEAIEKLSDPMYVSLYQAFLKTQENYTFYTAPKLDSYLDLETKFEELIRQTLSVKRLEWQEHPENMDKLVSETLEDFKAAYTQ